MLGVQLADRVEVREGLREGDRIVSSGVFLLDSESRLRATGAMAGHTHPTEATQPPAPAPPPAPAAPAPAPPSADPHTGHRE
jgi:Cu(I)/Ag(I) efflux system membrane fusion protein